MYAINNTCKYRLIIIIYFDLVLHLIKTLKLHHFKLHGLNAEKINKMLCSVAKHLLGECKQNICMESHSIKDVKPYEKSRLRRKKKG